MCPGSTKYSSRIWMHLQEFFILVIHQDYRWFFVFFLSLYYSSTRRDALSNPFFSLMVIINAYFVLLYYFRSHKLLKIVSGTNRDHHPFSSARMNLMTASTLRPMRITLSTSATLKRTTMTVSKMTVSHLFGMNLSNDSKSFVLKTGDMTRILAHPNSKWLA